MKIDTKQVSVVHRIHIPCNREVFTGRKLFKHGAMGLDYNFGTTEEKRRVITQEVRGTQIRDMGLIVAYVEICEFLLSSSWFLGILTIERPDIDFQGTTVAGHSKIN